MPIALILAMASPDAFAQAITQVSPKPQTQEQAQQQAQQKNDKGADLSKLLSVLSMAMGAMQMAKGAMDMQKCSSSPTPQPGSKTGMEEGVVAGAQTGMAASGDAVGGPTQIAIPTTGTACGDGPMQLAQGAMQMLQGLMGMQGAGQGQNNAAAAGVNAAKLGAITPSKIALGNKDTSANSGIKIDPNLLRNGKANLVLGEFEKKFGIPRDDFAGAVLSGVDPREILKSAPKNALSADTLNQAFGAAAKASDAEKAMAKASLAGLQDEALNTFEIPSVGSSGASKLSSSKKRSSELEPLDPSLLGVGITQNDDGSVSAHVQAALDAEAREQAERLRAPGSMTIFQQVHSKYKEKYVLIFGISAEQDIGDPTGKRKLAGIADAEGN
jgi:hypothetical protein